MGLQTAVLQAQLFAKTESKTYKEIEDNDESNPKPEDFESLGKPAFKKRGRLGRLKKPSKIARLLKAGGPGSGRHKENLVRQDHTQGGMEDWVSSVGSDRRLQKAFGKAISNPGSADQDFVSEYQHTQQELKKLGTGTVKLYRGDDKHSLDDYKDGLARSWTDDPGEAKVFGKLISHDVPVEHVFSSHLTNKHLDDEGENEFIVALPKDIKAGGPGSGWFADAGHIMHEKIGSAKGSNQGGLYKGTDGTERYVKFYHNAGQAHAEAAANSIYGSLGVPAPNSTIFSHKGSEAFASDIIHGGTTLQEKGLTKDRAREVLKGFAADVLLANWDSVGLTYDNILLSKEGKAHRVDNGATFQYRAQGATKPPALLNKASEYEGFFNPQINREYSQLAKVAGYKSADEIPDIKQQVSKIVTLEQTSGGWDNYLKQNAPYLTDSEHKLFSTMLTARMQELSARHPLTAAKAVFAAIAMEAGGPGSGWTTENGHVSHKTGSTHSNPTVLGPASKQQLQDLGFTYHHTHQVTLNHKKVNKDYYVNQAKGHALAISHNDWALGKIKASPNAALTSMDTTFKPLAQGTDKSTIKDALQQQGYKTDVITPSLQKVAQTQLSPELTKVMDQKTALQKITGTIKLLVDTKVQDALTKANMTFDPELSNNDKLEYLWKMGMVESKLIRMAVGLLICRRRTAQGPRTRGKYITSLPGHLAQFQTMQKDDALKKQVMDQYNQTTQKNGIALPSDNGLKDESKYDSKDTDPIDPPNVTPVDKPNKPTWIGNKNAQLNNDLHAYLVNKGYKYSSTTPTGVDSAIHTYKNEYGQKKYLKESAIPGVLDESTYKPTQEVDSQEGIPKEIKVVTDKAYRQKVADTVAQVLKDNPPEKLKSEYGYSSNLLGYSADGQMKLRMAAAKALGVPNHAVVEVQHQISSWTGSSHQKMRTDNLKIIDGAKDADPAWLIEHEVTKQQLKKAYGDTLNLYRGIGAGGYKAKGIGKSEEDMANQIQGVRLLSRSAAPKWDVTLLSYGSDSWSQHPGTAAGFASGGIKLHVPAIPVDYAITAHETNGNFGGGESEIVVAFPKGEIPINKETAIAASGQASDAMVFGAIGLLRKYGWKIDVKGNKIKIHAIDPRYRHLETQGITAGGPGSGRHKGFGTPKVPKTISRPPSTIKQQAAMKHYIPTTKKDHARAAQGEQMVRDAIGGIRTADNSAFDVLTPDGKHAIEVKVMGKQSNDKITMRKDALNRKYTWATKNHTKVHTIVLDMRHSSTPKTVYYRQGIGSFRIGNMTPLSDGLQGIPKALRSN